MTAASCSASISTKAKTASGSVIVSARVAHQTGVAQDGEQGGTGGEDVFFVGGEIQREEVIAVVRVEFGKGIIVVFPVFDGTADAFALGFAVEAAVDIAVDIAADFAAEAGERLEFGVIAPCVVRIGGDVHVAPGADVGEVGKTVEVVAEAGRCVVRDQTADNFLGCHSGTPLQMGISRENLFAKRFSRTLSKNLYTLWIYKVGADF
ncbi:MAG: hypothetical protein II333_09175 [Clostridia bacterium]|nr:hypothetical protein [Clostridia bacterium]